MSIYGHTWVKIEYKQLYFLILVTSKVLTEMNPEDPRNKDMLKYLTLLLQSVKEVE